MRITIAAAVVLVARVAIADPQSDKLFDEGRQLLDQGKAAEACEKFDRAIQIDPTAAGTMLNLGLCNEKLEKYATALYWFRKAQTAAAEARPRLPQHEQVAKEHTANLAEKVATIAIAFSSASGEAPAGAKIKIDQREVSADNYNRAEVDPGHHVLDAGARGMKNVHQEFDVQGKGGQTLTVAFVAGENAVVIDRGKTRRHAAIYTAIGGGLLWAASGVVGLVAKSNYDKDKVAANAGMMGGGSDCENITDPMTPLGRACAARHLASTWGTGLFIAGSVAVAAGAVIYFTAPQPEKLQQTVFTPTIDRNGFGVAVSGRF
jgi:tetratricopeptide (TPR) repeat protein